MTLLEKTPKLIPDVFSGFFDDDRFLNYDFRTAWPAKVPAANVFEHDNDYIIHLAVPGMSKEDFHIVTENRTLWVSAEKEERLQEKDEEFTRREFNFSSFRRSFMLPNNVLLEKVQAKYEDGILKIMIPKKEVEKKSPRKEIKIL